MNKIKVNSGIVSLLLLAGLFAGWEAMLIISMLLFLFCDADEQTKGVAVRVLTFFVGITLLSAAWNLITGGIDVVMDAIKSLFNTINLFKEPMDYINISKFTGTVDNIAGVASSVVTYLITLTKFLFVIALLSGRPAKNTPIASFLNNYISQAINFINGINITVNNTQK
jgi:hypothetical protein